MRPGPGSPITSGSASAQLARGEEQILLQFPLVRFLPRGPKLARKTSMSGFRISARLIGLTLIFIALGIAPASAQGDAPPLGAYNAPLKESSISGISSGAFMAVQF